MENPLISFNWTSLLVVPGMLLGYTVHELGHALMAYYLGDHSQAERHKITLNPLEHISWFGSFAFLLVGIGWPKTMQVNPRNLKRRHLDLFLVAISGPVASFTLGLAGVLLTLSVAATLVYFSGATTDQVFTLFVPLAKNLPQTFNVQAVAMAFTGYIAITSFILTVMSLLPLPGQDGFMALVSLFAFFREGAQPTVEEKTPVTAPQKPQLMRVSQQKRRNSAADIHFKIGAEYHTTEKYEDAVARYRQAIDNDQNFGPAYVNMGLAYLAKNERRRAIQAFRGATQHADDQRSQVEAWHQLQLLSEVSPVDLAEAKVQMEGMGAKPWTETKAKPDWWSLGFSGGLLLLGGLVLYAYLISQLLQVLQT
jgi:Zn-dependent protease